MGRSLLERCTGQGAGKVKDLYFVCSARGWCKSGGVDMNRAILVCLFLLLFAASVHAQIKLVQIAGNLDQPVDIANAGDGSLRLCFVLQSGKIMVYSSSVLNTPFLNISDLVSCCGEQGLLSLVFHPNYKSNGFFYVYYVNTSGNLVLARFQVSTNRNVANKNSKKILLTIPHPSFTNHNGGKLAFGKDGYLYPDDENNNLQVFGDNAMRIIGCWQNQRVLSNLFPCSVSRQQQQENKHKSKIKRDDKAK